MAKNKEKLIRRPNTISTLKCFSKEDKSKTMNKSETGYLVKRKLGIGTFEILNDTVCTSEFSIKSIITHNLYRCENVVIDIDLENEKVKVSYITNEFPDYKNSFFDTLILHPVEIL